MSGRRKPISTPKERYQAGHTDLVYWLRSHGEQLKRSGSEYEWDFEGERVTVRNHLWFNQYTREGGDAVGFLQYFYNYTEADAVSALLGVSLAEAASMNSARHRPSPPKIQQKSFIPPAANSDLRRVFAYLCKTRGIAPEVVSQFAHEKMLYESAEHHNAVFLGRDEQGKARHAHMRGTQPGVGFRQTVSGSEKEYSFHHIGTGNKLYVFEAPIDMLSYITLHPEDWQEQSYVALCGVGIQPIEHWLETGPQLEEVVLCLDHDKAGQKATLRIAKQLLREWEVTVSAEVPEHKDWNEDVQMGEAPKLSSCSIILE